MSGLSLFFLYRTTCLPTKQYFIGIHESTDLHFGTPEWRDPFVGSGAGIKRLIALGARRSHFSVQTLLCGNRETVQAAYDKIQFNYDDPLLLNGKPGAPAGVPKTPEHRAAIAAATAPAMIDNENAMGNVKVATEPVGDAIPIGKLKWFNDGTRSVILTTLDGTTPMNPEFKGWQLGQLRKKPIKRSSKPVKDTV